MERSDILLSVASSEREAKENLNVVGGEREGRPSFGWMRYLAGTSGFKQASSDGDGDGCHERQVCQVSFPLSPRALFNIVRQLT